MHRLAAPDEIAHFIVAAAERVRPGAFLADAQAGGKPQCHPRLMLALLVYGHADDGYAQLERKPL